MLATCICNFDYLNMSKHQKRTSGKNVAFPEIMLAAMNGLSILAPGVADGYYYEATIINWPDCENVEIQYNVFGDNVNVPVSECIVMPLKEAVVRPGMKALIKVYNVDNDRTFYLPGIVISPPSIDAKTKVERFTVALYNGIESNVRKDEIVLISKERYDAIVKNIESKVVDSNFGSNTTMTESMESYNDDNGAAGLTDIPENEGEWKATHFGEINRPLQSKSLGNKRLSKNTKSKPKDRASSVSRKSHVKIDEKIHESILPEETRDNPQREQRVPELVSDQNLIEAVVVDQNAPPQFNPSRSSRKIKQSIKTAPETIGKVPAFETSPDIQPLPNAHHLEQSVHSRHKEKPSMDRVITHVNEQKLLKKNDMTKSQDQKPSAPSRSFVNIDPKINAKVKESVVNNAIEGREFGVKNDDYRPQSSEVIDQTSRVTVSNAPVVNSEINTSPLASGEKTIPIFVAQQFPGPSNELQHDTRITDIPQSYIPFQGKPIEGGSALKPKLLSPPESVEREVRISAHSRTSSKKQHGTVQKFVPESEHRLLTHNVLAVPGENSTLRSSLLNLQPTGLDSRSKASSDLIVKKSSSKSSSSPKRPQQKNKDKNQKKSLVREKDTDNVVHKSKRKSSDTSNKPYQHQTQNNIPLMQNDTQRVSISTVKSKENTGPFDEGNDKRSQTAKPVFPRESFQKQTHSQEGKVVKKINGKNKIQKSKESEIEKDSERPQKEEIKEIHDDDSKKLNQRKVMDTEYKKNESKRKVDDDEVRKSKESHKRKNQHEKSDNKHKGMESNKKIDDAEARKSMASNTSLDELDNNEFEDENKRKESKKKGNDNEIRKDMISRKGTDHQEKKELEDIHNVKQSTKQSKSLDELDNNEFEDENKRKESKKKVNDNEIRKDMISRKGTGHQENKEPENVHNVKQTKKKVDENDVRKGKNMEEENKETDNLHRGNESKNKVDDDEVRKRKSSKIHQNQHSEPENKGKNSKKKGEEDEVKPKKETMIQHDKESQKKVDVEDTRKKKILEHQPQNQPNYTKNQSDQKGKESNGKKENNEVRKGKETPRGHKNKINEEHKEHDSKITSRSPSPFSAKSNVTIVEDGNTQVYNIVLTPEPAIVLMQPDSDCKSFQISQLTITVKESPSKLSSRSMLSPLSLLNRIKCDHAAKGLSKSSNDLCSQCHLPKVPFGPNHNLELKRSKSL